MRKMLLTIAAAGAIVVPQAQAMNGPSDHVSPRAAAPVRASGGFAWGAAGIGAGVAALALGAIGGGAAVVHRHARTIPA